MDIFKKEDFPLIHNGDPEIRIKIANIANHLLKERSEVGYTKWHGKEHLICEHVGTNFALNDTHKIYYFAEPLEEEKPKCDHEYKRIYSATAYLNADLEIIHKENEFCPNCGDKLERELNDR